MTRKDKRRFIRELVRNVTAGVLDRVPDMPDEWDGHELRHYLADKFAANARTLSPQKRREYRNTILVRNL